jgi:hypothetical protein
MVLVVSSHVVTLSGLDIYTANSFFYSTGQSQTRAKKPRVLTDMKVAMPR